MNIPINNSALLEAVAKVKESNTQENRLWLLKNLIDTSFVLPVVIVPAPVNNRIPADATVNYFSMKTSKGLVYLAVFTSGEELEKWNKNNNKMYLIRSYDSIKKMVLSVKGYDGFVIDPCGCNLAVQNSLIRDIEKLVNPEMIIKPERVETEGDTGLKPVKQPPSKLASALIEYFKTQDNIGAVYFMETTRKGADKATPVLVVDFCKDGDLKQAFDGIAAASHTVMEKGETIGLMPSFDKVAAKYIKGVTPFYNKNSEVQYE